MKPETSMCRYALRASSRRCLGVRLAIVFTLGWLTLFTFANSCLAEADTEPAAERPLIAAMPEAGTPPAPAAAAAVLAPATTPATTAAVPDEPVVNSLCPVAAEPAESAAAPAPATATATAPADGQPSAASDEGEVRQLSVAPETKPLLPADRPAWVGAAPDLSNPLRHRLFVGSFPTSHADEAEAALDEPMVAAVNGYIDEQVLDPGQAKDLHVTADFIRHNLLDRSTEYLAELSTSTGPLYQKWVVLEITPEHRNFFTDTYRQVEQKRRMVALGLGLAGVLGITGVAHLAFNRRRRRYIQPVQPVLQNVLHQHDPDAARRTSRILWIIAGCTGCMILLALLGISWTTLAYRARAAHPMAVQVEHEVSVYGEPPAPPVPPQAPEVYLEQVEMDHAMQAHREARERFQEARAEAEAHERAIELRGNGDR